MFRTAVWFIYFWISLFGSLPALHKVKKLDKAGDFEARDKIVRHKTSSWASRLLKLAGVKITIKGAEKLPKDEAFLFVGNHQGNFDIPILISQLDVMAGFIAKVEIKKLPIVRDWMHYLNCVFLDRDNPRESVRAINKGIENLKSGYSMVVFPEGTRSADGNLGDFKAGALKLATRSKVRVVPVTIKGSKDIMVKGSMRIRPANVELILSEPISTEEYSDKQTQELTDRIKEVISQNM